MVEDNYRIQKIRTLRVNRSAENLAENFIKRDLNWKWGSNIDATWRRLPPDCLHGDDDDVEDEDQDEDESESNCLRVAINAMILRFGGTWQAPFVRGMAQRSYAKWEELTARHLQRQLKQLKANSFIFVAYFRAPFGLHVQFAYCKRKLMQTTMMTTLSPTLPHIPPSLLQCAIWVVVPQSSLLAMSATHLSLICREKPWFVPLFYFPLSRSPLPSPNFPHSLQFGLHLPL